MKKIKLSRGKIIIIFNIINSLFSSICMLFYIFNIKLNYIVEIITFILLLGLNILVVCKVRKMNCYTSELEDKIEMLEVILENSPNAILLHKKLKVIYANNKAAQLFDVKDSSEIIGNPLERFININLEVVGQERIECALEEKEFEPLIEEVYIKKDGEVVELKVSSNPVKIKNSVCVLNVCRNITEKKKILELQKKIELDEKKLREKMQHDKLKEEFFSNLSHELRTPITIILGTVQLIEQNCKMKDDKLEKNYSILKQNSFRLLKLVNNLLDITKIDSGYFNINMQDCDIVSAVEDTVLSVADYIKSKGLYIEFDTNVEEKIISCDMDCIERIMLNLLSNSMKFTNRGGSIFVNVVDEKNNIKIVVKDTGIGIKEEDCDLIFDRFKQVDKSFRRNNEGSGIGLSIVKSLVELQGGIILLRSIYGEGTEFIIRFPIKKLVPNQTLNISQDKKKMCTGKVDLEFCDIEVR